MYSPYYSTHHYRYPNPHHLKHTVLSTVEPVVQYGLQEAKVTSYPHALREATAIAYLMGLGYDPMMARNIVESWEINEAFYSTERTKSES